MAEKEPEAEATTNEELETAALGYDDWEKHERGNPHAYAIGPVNVGRMQAPPEERKQSIRAEVFEELVRKRGGIAVFLRASTAFAKRHGIGTQKRAQTIESRVRAREPKG